MSTKNDTKNKETTHNPKPHTYNASTGAGGELHQQPRTEEDTLTTSLGTPVADDQNTLRIGTRGPAALEDFVFRDKIFHFDHERIPERVVHARGYSAHGYFETTDTLQDITSADIFRRKGEKTPVFVRFSTVAGSLGSSDLPRDVRGFAVKFYTKEGNWDLVGNNIPVFFIQDAIKFPDLVHAVKEEPDRGFPQAATAHDNFWDFISLMPESMHMIMWAMSDRAIPRSFRFMEGFGVHTFRFVNAEGKSTFVKFHWRPRQGMQSVVWNEAVKINGADADFHRRDLFTAIEAGDYPEWDLGVQLFDEEQADSFDFDILDSTKLIPEELVPLRIVGKLVLNRNIDNLFAENEQVAFCTNNIVPGIDFTNDPLLQGRNFSYLDTQLKRLGSPNFTHLPINAPKCPMRHFQQEGHMNFHSLKGRANYEPNSWGAENGTRAHAERGFKSFAEPVEGFKRRLRPESFGDHYSQARMFYVSQTAIEQKHMQDALTFELSKVERADIRERMVSHLLHIDEGLAKTVAKNLRISTLPKLYPTRIPPKKEAFISNALSILKKQKPTFKGRVLGLYITDGADAATVSALVGGVEQLGGRVEFIAPHIGGATLSDGREQPAHHQIAGGPSVLFDAVAIVSGAETKGILSCKASLDFVSDAFHHYKYIGFSATAEALLAKAGVAPDEAVIKLEGDIKTFLTGIQNHRFFTREEMLAA